jgi:hypothetical protein
MARSGWKKAERAVARDSGGQRIPVTGERAGADVISGRFHFQVKVRRALPVWLFDWLGGICDSAKRTQKTGVLVIRRPREPRRQALVIMRWDDWCALTKEAEQAQALIEEQAGEAI